MDTFTQAELDTIYWALNDQRNKAVSGVGFTGYNPTKARILTNLMAKVQELMPLVNAIRDASR